MQMKLVPQAIRINVTPIGTPHVSGTPRLGYCKVCQPKTNGTKEMNRVRSEYSPRIIEYLHYNYSSPLADGESFTGQLVRSSIDNESNRYSPHSY